MNKTVHEPNDKMDIKRIHTDDDTIALIKTNLETETELIDDSEFDTTQLKR